MAKTPNTLISRLGFQDEELKTPQHDEMMLWLDSYLDEWAARLGPSWDGIADAEQLIASCPKNGLAILDAPAASVRKKTWEYPIQTGTYVDGFLDLAVAISVPKLWVYRCAACRGLGGTCRETCDECGIEQTRSDVIYAFDVKPTIPSLGELIRQIRFYEAKFKRADQFIVVSPETRWTDALLAQRIGFLEYPSGEYSQPPIGA